MKSQTDQIRHRIRSIEEQVDAGTYRPGPWSALVREIRTLPGADRRALAADVSRASNALHRRAGHPEVSVVTGAALETVAVVASFVPLIGGIDTRSKVLSLGGALILAAAAQPLLKLIVGTLLGVRYAYAFLFGAEPRFKMRYGSYLARPRWARVVHHLSGTIGTPLALGFVSSIDAIPPWTRAVCWTLAVVIASANVFCFLAAAAGWTRLGPLRLSVTSGGSAGRELRGA